MKAERPGTISEKKEIPKKASTFELLGDGPEFFQELKGRIDASSTSVRLQSFLLGKDTVGGPIFDALEQAARRGVKVQVIADGMVPWPFDNVGARRFARGIQRLHEEGLPIDFHYPVEKGVKHSPFQRDHTKNIIIDAEIPEKAVSYIGGRNIWKKDVKNHDFMVRMTGEMVDFAKQDFDKTWLGIDVQPMVYVDRDGNQLFSDTRNTDMIPNKIIQMMRDAKQRILLETPYYDRMHVTPALLEVRHNPAKHVDIQFVTPLPISNNHTNYKVSSPFYMNELAEKGNDIPVFGYKRGDSFFRHVFSHTKLALIDDTVVIGSSNFSKRLLLGGKNAEIELFTRDPHLVAQLEAWFARDRALSVPRIPSKPTILDILYRRLRRKAEMPQ